MRSSFLLFVTLLSLTSCHFYGLYRVFGFIFINNAPYDISIIVDTNTEDNTITAGEKCYFVSAKTERYIDSNIPWEEVIKDSAYIYIIDETKICLPVGPLSQENLEIITPDTVLDTITFYHEQTLKKYPISYPSHIAQ